jgi:hypothetical protein
VSGAQPGWYPDPGGGQGLYRYWDGRAWSAATTANPNAAPPSAGLTGNGGSTGPSATGGAGQQPFGQSGQQQAYGQQTPGQQAGGYAAYQQVAKKKSPIGWWIGAGALVLVLVIVGVLVIRGLSSGTGPLANPQGPPSQDLCPTNEPSGATSAPEQQGDGRVHGGPLSYPMLPAPWDQPEPDPRLPFGTDVAVQSVTIEPNYQPGSSWVASVLIGKLNAGDGFYTPQQGSEVVVKCILGAFYSDNPVQSDVKINKATEIDGHEAWLVESQLSFDIEGLQAKGELLIVAIVATGAEDGSAGIFYASIPDNAKELIPPAREALKNLTVD